MKLLDIVSTASDYKKMGLLIAFPYCDFKCCKDANIPIEICQNSELATQPIVNMTVKEVVSYYNPNIHSALIFGGLEPLKSPKDMLDLIIEFRIQYPNDDIVIYTGYNQTEISDMVEILSKYTNLYMKFGRFVPDQKAHHDSVLDIDLISDNQYGMYLTEEWKPIENYSKYMVSSFGRIKSVGNSRNILHIIRKLNVNKKGYQLISITNDIGIRKTLKVHRLVADAFIPITNTNEQVNHKNGIKADNFVGNLEWCTNSENQKHAFKTKLNSNFGIENPNCILTESEVKEIRENKYKLTYKELGDKHGVTKSAISNIMRQKTWKL